MPEAYRHHWIDGSPIDLPLGKAVCVGRNYAEHARELGNEVPDEPVLFMKPASAMVGLGEPLELPEGQGEVHHEVEMALLIGERLRNVDSEQARYGVHGYGLALDLTLREVQNRLKEKGQPWERAKAFDGALPLSGFVEARGISVRQNLRVALDVNGELRQHGDTGQMLVPAFDLISYISRHFTLAPGDLVLTGTPAGVGPLASGDRLRMHLGNVLSASATLA
jgi:2-keto-4-pentenoate hydratase/2-oxohepta-3-ene-1,7-dioic acid hydratase in catechol pathway